MSRQKKLIIGIIHHFGPSILVVGLFVLMLFGRILPDLESNLIEQREKMIREIVNSTWCHIEEEYNLVLAGEMTEEKAKDHIISYFRNLRYGESGNDYFWIVNTDAEMVMHPFRTELEGRNLIAYRDEDSVNPFDEMIRVVGDSSEGYVRYKWQLKDDTSQVAAKISFVKLFKPWGWILGTGIYFKDIDQEIASIRLKIFLISFSILLLVAGVQVYLVMKWWNTETMRKNTENALMLRKEYYRTLFETSGDSMLILTEDGIFIDCNKATLDIFGLDSKDDIIGNHVSAFSPEFQTENILSSDKIPQRIARAKRNGTARFEWIHSRKDGTHFPTEVTLSLLPDQTFFAVVHDFTEKNKTLELLTQEKHFTETMIETSPSYFMLVKAPDEIVMANRAFLATTGYTMEEIRGKGYTSLLTVEQDREANTLQEITEGMVACGYESRILCRDGSTRTVSWYGRTIQASAYCDKCIFTFGMDITDQREMENALREREEELRITLSSIGEGVVSTDVEGRIIMMNSTASSITGWNIDDAKGRPLADVLDMGDDNLKTSILNADNDPLMTIQGTLHPQEGGEKLISISGSQILDDKGAMRGIAVVFRDITEETRLQEKLRHSRKLDAIGQLAGGIAHDFNNMLGGIIGAAELLALILPDDEEMQSYASMIISSSEKAADLTGRLLSFSRKGRKNITFFDVNKTVQDVMDILSHTIDRKIKIESSLEENEMILDGDETEIQNALLNLGLNARDAMLDGGTITFSTHAVKLDSDYCKSQSETAKAGYYVEVAVADTGKGIEESIRHRIFEPFFTTKETGKGTGLGLAAVYGTVLEHNGIINLYSEAGRGSVFKLYFPLAEGDLVKYIPPQIRPDILKGRSILIVDDDSVLRYTAERTIQIAGGTVSTVTNGNEAVQFFEQGNDVDLVILDMIMPEMGGIDTFRILKQIKPDIKVILSSGFSMDIEPIQKEGAVGFVQKPFRQEKLIQTILEVLSKKG